MIEDILEYNKVFVKNKMYERTRQASIPTRRLRS